MIQEQSAVNGPALSKPFQQFRLVGVGRVISQTTDFSFDVVRFPMDPNLLGTLGDDVTEGPRRLITDK